jgi:hypothetical protein
VETYGRVQATAAAARLGRPVHRDNPAWQALRSDYFNEQDTTATVSRAVARIKRPGYDVTLTPKAA